MTNTDYWDGLEKQLTSYLISDQCDFGWFLAVRYDDKPVSVTRTNDLAKRTASAATDTGFDLRAEWIDAEAQGICEQSVAGHSPVASYRSSAPGPSCSSDS